MFTKRDYKNKFSGDLSLRIVCKGKMQISFEMYLEMQTLLFGDINLHLINEIIMHKCK